MKRIFNNSPRLTTLPECLQGSYCVSFGAGTEAMGHNAMDLSTPILEDNEQSG
ncbi:MAG: hypothetical protein OJI67_14300 [Prosthecobacter sp.]|nr:hypothetical protein [Prosthecobacter sp.]